MPQPSTQLAILAATPVVAAHTALLAVVLLLARHAQAHPRHGLAPRFRNLRIAFLATRQPRSFRQPAANAFDSILDRGVDLVLHRAIACPSGCHGRSPVPTRSAPKDNADWLTKSATTRLS